jgi:hypothetical protein
MDDPMTIIQRHHQAVLTDPKLLHTISELSSILGAFSCIEDCEKNNVMTWMTEEDGVFAQLSRHGVFITDGVLTKEQRYQVTGMCCLYGIPVFTDDAVYYMLDKETTENCIN